MGAVEETEILDAEENCIAVSNVQENVNYTTVNMEGKYLDVKNT